MATLRTWLEWMEVDLDEAINLGNNTQWILPSDAYKAAVLGPTGLNRFDFPRPRLTGASPSSPAHLTPSASPDIDRSTSPAATRFRREV